MKKILFAAFLLFGLTVSAQVELISGGSANAYTLAFPGVFSYSNGIAVTFKSNFANTGAVTINVNGLGTKTIKKLGSTTDLDANDILIGQVVSLVYDGTNFQMISGLGNAPSGGGGGGTLAGDVTGAIGTNTVEKIRGVNVLGIPPSMNQVLQFNGVSWAPTTLGSGGGNPAWELGGNAAGASDFIGTTNSETLKFQANGTQYLELQTNGRLFQFMNNDNTAFGENAMPTSIYGGDNTAIGKRALSNMGNGFYNTAIGRNALASATNAQDNVAVGYQALSTMVNQANNTAIGSKALRFNTSEKNTAVGANTISTNITGYANTALGYNADVGTLGYNNATAIGAEAFVNAPNSIVLGAINGVNGASSSTSVGIGTTQPSASLHIETTTLGTGFRLKDGSQGNGKVLTSDVNGYGRWVTPSGGGGGGSGWELTGNSGTDSTLNYIGTNDATPLLFHSGNTERMKLRQDGGLETKMDNQNIALGSSALLNSNSYNSIAIGIESGRNLYGNSIAIGTHALDEAYYDESNAGNIAIGHEAMATHNEMGGNTAVGNRALNHIGGYWNTAVGVNAMPYATVTAGNTVVGAWALYNNISGSQNLALGSGADVLVDNLEYASAIGAGSHVGVSNGMVLGRDSGVTFVGIGTSYPEAAFDLHGQFKYVFGVPGFGKVLTSDANGNATWQAPSGGGGGGAGWNLVGNAATDPNSNFVGTVDPQPLIFRVNNVKVGKLDLLKNVALGDNALRNNTTGENNVAIGSGSLQGNTIGGSMVAIGDSALYNQAVSYGNNFYNLAIGSHALYSNGQGNYNLAIGTDALRFATGGQMNVAVGLGSMNYGGNGIFNTAIGVNSLYQGEGSYNCAFGKAALLINTGSQNVGMGFESVYASSGDGNVGIGYSALWSNGAGSYNTSIGYYANVSSGNLTNATALGNSAVVNTSNKIRLGDANVTVIEGQVAYTFPSDARFKTNINTTDVKGLDFISKLRPVNYNFDTKKYEEFLTKNMPDSIRRKYLEKDFSKSTAMRQTGFIAQEVEKAAKDAGYDFSGGLHIPENENDNYSVAYSQFVVPLVKSVQELNAKVEALEKENAALKSKSGTPVATAYETTYFKTKTISAEDLQKQINDLKKALEELKRK